MIKPPPIQEPWRLDQNGKLFSSAWVLWLQDLVNSAQMDELFTGSLLSQSTNMLSTETSSTNDDLEQQINAITSQSATSIEYDDALMFSWLSF